jgi:hypothetical protein
MTGRECLTKTRRRFLTLPERVLEAAAGKMGGRRSGALIGRYKSVKVPVSKKLTFVPAVWSIFM